MTYIIEQCARAANDAYQRAYGDSHLRVAALPNQSALSMTTAILAKFRELTAEPTDAMLKAATNVVKNYHGPDSLPCKAAMRAMNEQMWEDIL